MCSCIYRSIHGSKPCNEYQQTGTQPGWVILKRPGCVVCWGPKIKQFWLLSAVMGATKKMAREYPVTPWHWLRQWQFNDLNTAIKNRWYLRWSRLRFIFQVYTIHITIYIYIIIIYYFNYQHLIFINIYIYYSNYKVFPKNNSGRIIQYMSTLMIEAPQHRHGGGPQNRGVSNCWKATGETQERKVKFIAV